jgi:tRNA/tmRNA/rRNA uracil-C5-methylase (TrmA/RlmC/RlmD family)
MTYGHEFGTILMDPPRAGLDDETIRLVLRNRQLVHLLYVSCNPESLQRDLKKLKAKGGASASASVGDGSKEVRCSDRGADGGDDGFEFEVMRLVVLDHFPYTEHTECAVWLRRLRA